MTHNRVRDFMGADTFPFTHFEKREAVFADVSDDRSAIVSYLIVSSPEELAERIRQNLRIVELERQQRAFRIEMDQLKRQLASDKSDTRVADPRIADVIRITQEMFPDGVSVELAHDPEDAEHPFVVFNVSSNAEPRQIIGQRLEWHRRVAELAPGDSGTLRLSVVPS